MSNRRSYFPARLVGGLFLVILFVGPFSLLYVPSVTFAPGDQARTVSLLGEHLMMLRYGVLGELIIALVEIGMVVALWRLFRGVRDDLLRGALIARLLQVAVMSISMVAGVTALAAAARGASPDLQMFLMEIRAAVQPVWEGFFGLHLLLLAPVVAASGIVPRLLGAGLLIAGIAYLLNSLGPLALPALAPITEQATGVAAFVGEVPLFIWLLARGVRPTVSPALA